MWCVRNQGTSQYKYIFPVLLFWNRTPNLRYENRAAEQMVELQTVPMEH